MSSTTDWLLNNIGKATRWRGDTPDGDGCTHDCEGGVDIGLPGGTPIYALANGTLEGNGLAFHPDGSPIHGVVTELVPGTGYVYYQHIDLASNIPTCTNGDCGGYQVKAGQYLGKVRPDMGEVEVGINPGWGGPWGPNPKPAPYSTWVLDPRAQLTSLAQSGGTATPAAGSGSCAFWDFSCWCSKLPQTSAFALCAVAPPVQSGSSDVIASGATGGCAPWDIGCILQQDSATIRSGLIQVGLFLLGLLMFGIGFFLLFSGGNNPVLKIEDKAIDTVLGAAPGGGQGAPLPPAAAPAKGAPQGGKGALTHKSTPATRAQKVAQAAKLAEVAA